MSVALTEPLAGASCPVLGLGHHRGKAISSIQAVS